MIPIMNISFDCKNQQIPQKKNIQTGLFSSALKKDVFSKSDNISFGNFYQDLFKNNQTRILTRFIQSSEDNYILLSLISSELKDKAQTVRSLHRQLIESEYLPHKVDFKKHVNIFKSVEKKLQPYFEWEDNYKTFIHICTSAKRTGFLTEEQIKNYYLTLYKKPDELVELIPAAQYYKNLKEEMKTQSFKNKPLADITEIYKAQQYINNLKEQIPYEEANLLLFKIIHYQPQHLSTLEFEKLTEESSLLCKKINDYNIKKNMITQNIREFEIPIDMKAIEKSFNEQYEHNKKILDKFAANLYNYFLKNNIHIHHKTSRTVYKMLSKQQETNLALKAGYEDYLKKSLKK